MLRNQKYLIDLVKHLIKYPKETEWLEFKTNYYQPEEIERYISALSNSATLCEKPYAYMIWGIDDKTHEIVGTDFDFSNKKVGNEEFENWLHRLLNPKIELYKEHIKVTLFAHMPYSKMTKEDKLRACYLHACLKYVNNDYLTNTSLRERFGIEPKNNAMVSRIIKNTIDENLIKPYEEDTAPRYMKYVPYWA